MLFACMCDLQHFLHSSFWEVAYSTKNDLKKCEEIISHHPEHLLEHQNNHRVNYMVKSRKGIIISFKIGFPAKCRRNSKETENLILAYLNHHYQHFIEWKS